MRLDNYTDSLNTFEKFLGSYLNEFISDLKYLHGIDVDDPNALFYAKGFHADNITDKLYYFGKETIKIVTLNKNEEEKLEGVTISYRKTSSITETALTLDIKESVKLLIDFADGEKIEFDNKKDSDNKRINVLGNQIKNIYKLLTE